MKELFENWRRYTKEVLETQKSERLTEAGVKGMRQGKDGKGRKTIVVDYEGPDGKTVQGSARIIKGNISGARARAIEQARTKAKGSKRTEKGGAAAGSPPALSTGHHRAGMKLYDKKDFKKAAYHFDKASTMDPEANDLVWNSARAHEQAGNIDVARERYQKLLSMGKDPKRPGRHDKAKKRLAGLQGKKSIASKDKVQKLKGKTVTTTREPHGYTVSSDAGQPDHLQRDLKTGEKIHYNVSKLGRAEPARPGEVTYEPYPSGAAKTKVVAPETLPMAQTSAAAARQGGDIDDATARSVDKMVGKGKTKAGAPVATMVPTAGAEPPASKKAAAAIEPGMSRKQVSDILRSQNLDPKSAWWTKLKYNDPMRKQYRAWYKSKGGSKAKKAPGQMSASSKRKAKALIDKSAADTSRIARQATSQARGAAPAANTVNIPGVGKRQTPADWASWSQREKNNWIKGHIPPEQR